MTVPPQIWRKGVMLLVALIGVAIIPGYWALSAAGLLSCLYVAASGYLQNQNRDNRQDAPIIPLNSGNSAGGFWPLAAISVAEEPEPDDEETVDNVVELQRPRFTLQQALDPATAPEVLAQIAAEAPHLRPQVAENPATYPALLDWLADLDDIDVNLSLQRRNANSAHATRAA